MHLRVAIQQEPFDLGAEVTLLAADGTTGAVASFTGHVRAEEGLVSLTLEHYPGMTQAQITHMAQDAGSRWALIGVTVIHRIGTLKPGEAIVLVAAASAHREAAFAACEFLMDYLKTQAPFWKEEARDDGKRWVKARTRDDAAAARWKR